VLYDDWGEGQLRTDEHTSFFYRKLGEAESKHMQSEKQNENLLEVFLVTYRKVNLLVVYAKS
jgi:hypothetical protein